MAEILQNTFSVAVAAYLLVRMESRLDELSSAIVRLNSSIELLVMGDARGKGGLRDYEGS
jgi:hypothetical protein